MWYNACGLSITAEEPSNDEIRGGIRIRVQRDTATSVTSRLSRKTQASAVGWPARSLYHHNSDERCIMQGHMLITRACHLGKRSRSLVCPLAHRRTSSDPRGPRSSRASLDTHTPPI